MNNMNQTILIVSILLLFSCSQQTKKETEMNNEAYKKTMDRLIEDVWNNQNLDILDEVFTEDAVLHIGGLEYNLKGIPEFREKYMRATMIAFPDIKHSYDKLIMEGDMIAMMFYGEGTHKEEYDGIPATNKVLRYRGMAFFRMEGNRIAEVWTHSNWATQFSKLNN
ncbi:MAG: ester cyclase [Candidatus Scalindua sp.]